LVKMSELASLSTTSVIPLNNVTTNTNFTGFNATHYIDFFFKYIYLLLVVIVGCIGNLFVIIIFGQKTLRTGSSGNSVSVYPFLLYMAMSDTLYLIILFLLWLSNFVNILHRPVICQLTLYCTYVCNFINAYYTVSFTAQRLFAVTKPFRASDVLSCYILFLVTIVPVPGSSKKMCFSRNSTRWINELMDIVDCFVVFVIPYVNVITMNSIMLFTLTYGMKRENFGFGETKINHVNKAREITRRNASRRMTKLLLTVSTSYLIVCGPYFFTHTWRLLRHNKTNGKLLNTLEGYFHYIHHISFAMNFYIYIAFGARFRRESKRLCSKWKLTLLRNTKKSKQIQQHQNYHCYGGQSSEPFEKGDLLEQMYTSSRTLCTMAKRGTYCTLSTKGRSPHREN
ncbi:unnamed protein product, partial [Didymodactylos carnosus]